MEMEAVGTVVSVFKQWWFKVNTKPVRMHALDGAQFPHVIKIEYRVEGKTYIRWKWIHAGYPVPKVGSAVKVLYCVEKPKKSKLM